MCSSILKVLVVVGTTLVSMACYWPCDTFTAHAFLAKGVNSIIAMYVLFVLLVVIL